MVASSVNNSVLTNQGYSGVNITNGSSTSQNKSCSHSERASSETREFKDLTKRDALNHLRADVEKLISTVPEDQTEAAKKNFAGFITYYEQFLKGDGAVVDWNKIEKLPEDAVIDYCSLNAPSKDKIKSILNKLVVVKLNGGLGTSMGMNGPKSTVAVRDELTFLDLTVQQIEHLNKKYGSNVPLVLMNSFNTDEEIHKVIKKYNGLNIQIYTFNQSWYPRICKETLLPIATDCDIDSDKEAWYPPGHGDFYASFNNSGLLDRFIQEGFEYCFISNIDNLGATVDINILELLVNSSPTKEIVIELTEKTRADVKGGTIIRYEDKLRLLELIQVPKEHIEDFKSVKYFKYFNTNNIWINLSAMKKKVDEGLIDLEVMVNPKTTLNNINVIQLETAVGAAMKSFNGSLGINVPRSRFLPVKKTQDLLLVMSNLYVLKNAFLTMSPQRAFPTTPVVKLGDHFSKIKDFFKRFKKIPDIIELDHLTVSGDVTFGKGVSLRGTVIVIANHGERIDIPDGAVLENKIVSGNLRILEH
ncbi:UTP--glucose-1-phosphate uridylyltransferase isoform X1 [Planococcus citri]|uniref:UTP--glucose-1-phosphate uridylyltransferase isoform X1 n=1 Tax=Planococcus citri TaxID=170843 RepID=UPI0031F7F59E